MDEHVDLIDGPERTRVMAYIGMVLGMCPPLATLLGGQLHVYAGWRTGFGLMAVLSVLLMVAAWRGLPARAKAPAPDSHWLAAMGRAYARLAREKTFWLYVTVLASSTAAFYVFLTGTPLVLSGYGVRPENIGWTIMAVPLSYILGNYLTSHWIHRRGERRVMKLGMRATLVGLATLLALSLAGWHNPLALALPLLLVGLGHGFLNPPALAGTVGVVPALAGSAAAVAGLLQQLMGAVAGYVVGLVSHQGAFNLGLLMIAFSLVGAVALVLLHRR